MFLRERYMTVNQFSMHTLLLDINYTDIESWGDRPSGMWSFLKNLITCLRLSLMPHSGNGIYHQLLVLLCQSQHLQVFPAQQCQAVHPYLLLHAPQSGFKCCLHLVPHLKLPLINPEGLSEEGRG